MTDPAHLSPSAVTIPPPELHEAIVHDNASADREEVRCIVPSKDQSAATDPMPWMPYVTPAGVFYPKRDDRAILGFPIDGPPLILYWQPKATEPDIPF